MTIRAFVINDVFLIQMLAQEERPQRRAVMELFMYFAVRGIFVIPANFMKDFPEYEDAMKKFFVTKQEAHRIIRYYGADMVPGVLVKLVNVDQVPRIEQVRKLLEGGK